MNVVVKAAQPPDPPIEVLQARRTNEVLAALRLHYRVLVEALAPS